MELMDVTLRENIEFDGLLDYNRGLEYLKYVTKNISSEDVQYVELGYIDTTWYSHPQYDPYYLENAIKINDGKFKLSAIIHPDRVNLDDLDKDLVSQLSVIRIVNIGDILPDNVQDQVDYIRSIGVDSSINIAYVMRKKLETFVGLYERALSFNPDIIYCADSSGSAMPTKMAEIIKAMKEHRGSNRIGAHLHDHMSFAMANAILAYDEKLDYTDFSITGDGKGGGNLKTEMFIPMKRILDEKQITEELLYGVLDYIQYYESLIGRETDVNVINYLNTLGGVFRFKSALMEKITKEAKGDYKEFVRIMIENAREDKCLVYSNGKCGLE